MSGKVQPQKDKKSEMVPLANTVKSDQAKSNKKPAQKPKDRIAEKEQTKLLLSILWEQKWLLVVAFPFMFLGGITDFLFPDLISNVIDAM
jgi:hypothetical protein